MAASTRSAGICTQCLRQSGGKITGRRAFSHTAQARADLEETTANAEQPPVESDAAGMGPRRRRALIQQLGSSAITFDQMPYQCFQEARKLLRADRELKLAEISKRREKIARLEAQEVAPQNEASRELRLKSMRQALEELKIFADINDPVVKKKFEDGQADFNKPIYRHLADKRWREYKRKVAIQRVEQMHVIPDVLPDIDPVVSTDILFGAHKIAHGQLVNSAVSETAPVITIQPFDQGVRLYTIAFINPDVPNVAEDSFSTRCHFLAVNVAVSPVSTTIDLAKLEDSQIVLPWLPPHSQKGLKYQRIAVCIFEQPAKDDAAASESRSQPLDIAAVKQTKSGEREGLTARALVTRHRLKPVGIDLIRTEYDENTDGVMQRAGLIGADVEFKRKRTDPLPYKRLKSNRYR